MTNPRTKIESTHGIAIGALLLVLLGVFTFRTFRGSLLDNDSAERSLKSPNTPEHSASPPTSTPQRPAVESKIPTPKDFEYNLQKLKGQSLQSYIAMNGDLLFQLSNAKFEEILSSLPPGDELLGVLSSVTVELANRDWRRCLDFLDEMQDLIPQDSLRARKLWVLKIALSDHSVSTEAAAELLFKNRQIADISKAELGELWGGLAMRDAKRAASLMDLIPRDARGDVLKDSPFLVQSLATKSSASEAAILIEAVENPAIENELLQRFGSAYAKFLLTAQATDTSLRQDISEFASRIRNDEARDSYLHSAITAVLQSDVNKGLGIIATITDENLRRRIILDNFTYIERWDPEAAKEWQRTASGEQ